MKFRDKLDTFLNEESTKVRSYVDKEKLLVLHKGQHGAGMFGSITLGNVGSVGYSDSSNVTTTKGLPYDKALKLYNKLIAKIEAEIKKY